MLWHVVKFRYKAEIDAQRRDAFEDMLRGLAGAVETLRFVRVGPSMDEPDVVGLLTGFDDAEGLEAYKIHPAHLPVIEEVKAVAAEVVRLDLFTDDPADTLPLRG